MSVELIRMAVEPVLEDVARKRRCSVPDITDEELACIKNPADRMAIFRFVIDKLRGHTNVA